MSLKKTIIKKKGILSVIIICFIVLLPFLCFKNSLFVIMDKSMEPSLKIGDLVIKGEKSSEKIIADDINGDILIIKGPEYYYRKGLNPIFWNNLNNNTIIIHRAINKILINDTWLFLTKGDNNRAPDGAYEIINENNNSITIQINYTDGIYIPESEIIGIVSIKISFIGYFKIYFIHILITIIVIGIIVCILHILKYKIKIEKISRS
ncbi:MAG: hypothetical protein JXA99_15045 [Candidatus Lokiarchaeota archaeon]|nr:hypothetical protein [Candidatus Lokiarchaeota archaeon]